MLHLHHGRRALNPDPNHVVNGAVCALPSARQLAAQCVHVDETTKLKLPEPPQPPHIITAAEPAQLDSGADVTCTNTVETLHEDHRECDKSSPCKV